MTDDQKAAAYYKFGALHEAPPFVPATVRTTRTLYGDFPFRGAGVLAGDHECRSNKWGAVSVTDRNGNQLGLRLNEFEPLTWRENLPPNAALTERGGVK